MFILLFTVTISFQMQYVVISPYMLILEIFGAYTIYHSFLQALYSVQHTHYFFLKKNIKTSVYKFCIFGEVTLTLFCIRHVQHQPLCVIVQTLCVQLYTNAESAFLILKVEHAKQETKLQKVICHALWYAPTPAKFPECKTIFHLS